MLPCDPADAAGQRPAHAAAVQETPGGADEGHSSLSSSLASTASDSDVASAAHSPSSRSPGGHDASFEAHRRAGRLPISDIQPTGSSCSTSSSTTDCSRTESASASADGAAAISKLRLRLGSLEGLSSETPASPGSTGPAMPRECSRKLWQADAEAKVCSMQTCSNEFSIASYIPGFSSAARRRHHCRQCGRVVCSECSKGTKLMLPAHTKTGSAKSVRVCNACLYGGETFHFRSNPGSQAGIMQAMLSSSRSSSPMVRRAISRRGSDLAADMMAAVDKVLKSSASSPSLMTLEHATSPLVMDAATERPHLSPDHRDVSGSTMESMRGGNSQLSCADTPEVIMAQGQPPADYPDDKAISDMYRKQDVECRKNDPIVDERMRQLQQELEASSYYQGLKQYEPAALAALTGAMGGLC